MVEASKFLKAYVTDAKRRKCLEAFADCQKIVEWIRNETKGLNFSLMLMYFIDYNAINDMTHCNYYN